MIVTLFFFSQLTIGSSMEAREPYVGILEDSRVGVLPRICDCARLLGGTETSGVSSMAMIPRWLHSVNKMLLIIMTIIMIKIIAAGSQQQ